MKKIDFHVHTTRNPLKGMHVTGASPEYIVHHMDHHDIEKSVVLATYFPHRKRGKHNYKMLDLVAEYPEKFIVFGSLDIENNRDAGVAELETLLKQEKINGIKLYPGYQRFYPGGTAVDPVYRLACEYDVPVMIHTGETLGQGEFPAAHEVDQSRPDKYYHFASHPFHVSSLPRRFPQLKLVLAHYGMPFMKAMRTMLNASPNIHTDLSGLWTTGDQDMQEYEFTMREIEKLAQECNPEQVLFGSDFPVQSIRDSIDIVHHMKLSPEDEHKVFYGNAQRLLKLGESNGR